MTKTATLVVSAFIVLGCDPSATPKSNDATLDLGQLQETVCQGPDATANIEACSDMKSFARAKAYAPRAETPASFGQCHAFGEGRGTSWVLMRPGHMRKGDLLEEKSADETTLDAVSVRRIVPQSYQERRELEQLVDAYERGKPLPTSGVLKALQGIARSQGTLRPITAAGDGSTYLPPVTKHATAQCEHSCAPDTHIYLRAEPARDLMVELDDGGTAWVCRLWPLPN